MGRVSGLVAGILTLVLSGSAQAVSVGGSLTQSEPFESTAGISIGTSPGVVTYRHWTPLSALLKGSAGVNNLVFDPVPAGPRAMDGAGNLPQSVSFDLSGVEGNPVPLSSGPLSTTSVSVPPAVWLLGAAFVALVGVARRSQLRSRRDPPVSI